MAEEIKVSKLFFIKTKSNMGDFSKQYIFTAYPETMEGSLIIRKLLLVDSNKGFPDNFKIIKTFKDRLLIETSFSIKMSSLNAMIQTLNSLGQKI